MNIIKPYKFLLLFLFVCASPIYAEQISSKELKKTFEKTTGITMPKVPKGMEGEVMISQFLSPFTFKGKAFPERRLEEELKENYTLFEELGMNLPIIMTAFINKKELTNAQLLLAVRVSRYINSQIPTLKDQKESK